MRQCVASAEIRCKDIFNDLEKNIARVLDSFRSIICIDFHIVCIAIVGIITQLICGQ